MKIKDACQQSSYIYIFSAYLIWGLSPIYFKNIAFLDSSEIIAHCILWSAVFCLILLFFYKQTGWVKSLMARPKNLILLTITGLLSSSNLWVYIWAINNGYMLETSLGSYINPLISILMGMFFLGERLGKLQCLAVFLAFIAVAIQLYLVGEVPWISLFLAFSFACYGLIRKLIPIGALYGMTVEALALLPIVLIWLYLHPNFVTNSSTFWLNGSLFLCILAGPITLVPLLLFNLAVKKLPYYIIGFCQYISPSLVFLQAILLFDEPLFLDKLITFSIIWLALIILSIDMYLRRDTK